VTLRRSGGGVFEIRVGERIAYSKKATGRFPTPMRRSPMS
jgi:predicted Rdx family selenoprotein